MNEKHTVDTRGYMCPIPVSMVSRKMNSLVTGEHLTVLADDADFKNDISRWCYETGNRLIHTGKEEGTHVVEIQRGEGFHGETIMERMKFYALGVKLHVVAILLKILPVRKINYLVTFSSINEGIRADQWLQSDVNDMNVSYTMLPVPEEITDHCGVVFGFSELKNAKKMYNYLKENKFVVEDIYQKDKQEQFEIVT